MSEPFDDYVLRSAARPYADVQPAYLKHHISELLKERDALAVRVQRAERVEAAVHEALEQLDQDMPLLAGVTLLLAVAEVPQPAALGGDRR